MNTKSELVQAGTNQLQPASDSTTLMQAIVNASSDSTIDVEKMERLWAMKEKIDAKEAEMHFNSAMVEAQAEMRPIAADADNKQTKSKYASYAALDRALRLIYSKHGFALSFDTSDSPKELHVRVLCYLSHTSGHSRAHHVDMPADGKGAKGGDVMTLTHAAGAALAYGMRYLLKMIFNVAVGEDDKDGNQPIPRITEDQINQIHAAITDNSLNMNKFLAWLKRAIKVNSITDINVNAFDTVVREIESVIKGRRNAKD